MKKYVSILCVLLALAAVNAAYGQSYNISVSQFVEHPALDAVLKGFQDYRKKTGDGRIQHSQCAGQHGHGHQIANQIMGEKPDLILAIATPTAQACAQALKKRPTWPRPRCCSPPSPTRLPPAW